MQNKTVLSGIQPSGQLMLGNYLGAIKHWLSLQQNNSTLFTIVDLHAITVRHEPDLLHKQIYDCLAMYLACGLDPKKSTIFIQSHVPAHAQLGWILNCYASYGELTRMTQFKDKSLQHQENINCGLFTYPVLMAADILLYNTDIVPVGDDQKQHLELARNIAIRFNKLYGNIFKIPNPLIAKHGARIMSLQNPTNKMSKSDQNTNSFITLLDSKDAISKKIKRCVTDSVGKINLDSINQPGITNLLQILSITSNKNLNDTANEYSDKNYSVLKNDVIDSIINLLTPIQEKYAEIRNDHNMLNTIAEEGGKKAQTLSNIMLDKVHSCIGLSYA